MSTTLRAVDPLIAEFEQEAQTTQRVLERVPGDKLTWRPHPKSMTLGQLALHIASINGVISGFLELEGFDVTEAKFQPDQPASKEEIMQRFADSKTQGRQRLESLDDARAMESWTLSNGGEAVFTIPKIGLARTLMFNHLYHHRGQLSVYLRLLDVPVPVTYGRSADESPF